MRSLRASTWKLFRGEALLRRPRITPNLLRIVGDGWARGLDPMGQLVTLLITRYSVDHDGLLWAIAQVRY